MLIHLLSPMPIFAHSTSAGNSHSAWLVGCKASARNLTLDLYWTCCTSMTMNLVGKSWLALPSQKTQHRVSKIRHKLRTWYWIIWSLPLVPRKTVSTIARRLLRPLSLKRSSFWLQEIHPLSHVPQQVTSNSTNIIQLSNAHKKKAVPNETSTLVKN